jgi:hypothetical protein
MKSDIGGRDIGKGEIVVRPRLLKSPDMSS